MRRRRPVVEPAPRESAKTSPDTEQPVEIPRWVTNDAANGIAGAVDDFLLLRRLRRARRSSTTTTAWLRDPTLTDANGNPIIPSEPTENQ